MQNQDNPKSTEITSIRLFKFVYNTVGLRNVAQTMSGYFENIIKDLPCCYSYVNGHIASTDEESHKSEIELVFRRLDNHGIFVPPCLVSHTVSDVLITIASLVVLTVTTKEIAGITRMKHTA
ncbi:transposon Ty3-I Gag-Pol polyprotein, partial [Nephila pilipes]